MRQPSLYLLVTFNLLALSGCAPDLSPVVTVVEPVERSLSGTEPQRHQMELPANQLFRVQVEQLGIDAIVEVQTPGGQSIVTVNSPTERAGNETVLLQTANAGPYQVLVRSNEYASKKGRYRLTIDQLANKTRDDKRRITALKALTEAAQLNFAVAASSSAKVIEQLRTEAVQQYEIARSIWANLHNGEEQAWALYYLATEHFQLFDWKRAEKCARQASRLFRQSDDLRTLASVLRFRADVLADTQEKADFQHARELFEKALAIQQSAGNRYEQALTINALGTGFYRQSKLIKAREQFVKASNIFAALKETRQTIQLLNNIATTDQMLDKYANAIESYSKALVLSESDEFRLERAFLLQNRATAYTFVGELQNALLDYRAAAELYDSIGDRLGMARVLSGTGITYSRLGNWQAALNFFEQALQQQGSVENSNLVTTYLKIGNAHRNLDHLSQALTAHEQALEAAKLPAEKASALVELGRDYAIKGDYPEAIESFNQALTFATGAEAAVSRAFALQERGQLGIRTETNIAQGLQDLRMALKAHKSLNSAVGAAQSLQALARGEQKLGHSRQALAFAEEALEITETLRIRVGSPDLRVSFTGLQLPTYELQIALLMDLANSQEEKPETDYAALALEVSERARARSLVELLTEAGTDEGQGIAPELLQTRDELRKELAGLVYRMETLSAAGEGDADSVQNALQSVQAELDVIDARIRKQNRRYAELTQPELPRAAALQSLLAPGRDETLETVLLEYSLGEQQSFLWCVTSSSIHSWTLPERTKIEALARQVYESFKMLDVDRASGLAAQRASEKLAKLVLTPAAECIKGKRMVIVPDGALQYIPFGALPVRRSGRPSVRLVEEHEIVTLPSASTLAVLRDAQRKRQPPNKAIAIFADPVFSYEDARLAGIVQRERHAATRFAEESDRSLMRLPASGKEADAIANLARPGSVLEATGFAASRANVLNTPLADYRRVHFATHGLINSQYPELSSLALSAFDKNGMPQPGFLRLHDVYSLKLNADLVVLSACEAALGREIRGEGLIGLTRGFMYAGTSRVVASLWRAPDAVTALLMQKFYWQMLKKKLAPAAALRKAQLEIAAQRKWRHPYYWAGFILQGDWRSRDDVADRSINLAAVTSVARAKEAGDTNMEKLHNQYRQ